MQRDALSEELLNENTDNNYRIYCSAAEKQCNLLCLRYLPLIALKFKAIDQLFVAEHRD